MHNEIIINRVNSEEEFEIVPLKRKRQWMNETNDSYAYQCMPLSIVNEYGWAVLSPAQFTATWDGTDSLDCVTVKYEDGESYNFAQSHFGHGILTISVDFVLQTPPEISTYIRGIPNTPIDDLQPLDAIVETDWLPFTFTYNYRFKKPCTVKFEKDEPLFCFFPIKRGDIESFSLHSRRIEEDEEFFKKYNEFENARQYYLDNKHNPKVEKKTSRYYMDAKSPSGDSYSVIKHVKKVMTSKPKPKGLHCQDNKGEKLKREKNNEK